MNCEEFRRGLETAIENRVIPDFTEGREHLKHCPRCRALSEDYHIIERAVEEWAVVDESPDLSGRVLAMLSNDGDLPRPPQSDASYSQFVPVLVGLSAVAALFLIVYLTQGLDQHQETITQSLPELEYQTDGPPPLEIEYDIEMERVIGDTKAAYNSFVDNVKEPFEPLTDAVTGGIADSEGALPPERAPQDPVNPLPKELVVFNDELNTSLGFLRKVFPSPSSSP